ncbi:S8 family serine peptidase [Streptomyces sp. NPDC047042]|uniref:S8 family serine peptidase n=1 Tax=Streptomyces sp. NPDC047042 TaxID=3154807 RepID=UPI0033EF495D
MLGMVGGALPATAVPGPGADGSAGAPPPVQGTVGRTVERITLITGDTVALDARGRVTEVRRGPGRAGIPVSVQRFAGHTYVTPVDVVGLLAEGRLDRRLFDVTGLAAADYDDAHRRTLPLIVTYGKGAAQGDARQALRAADADVQRPLPAVRGESIAAPKARIGQVLAALTDRPAGRAGALQTAPGVDRVWLDGLRKLPADRGLTAARQAGAPDPEGGPVQIGAPVAWKAGYDGKGVDVAVLDTGIDATHPDVKKAILKAEDFSGSGTTDDTDGHGTHVASIIAGSGARSDGKYMGVAPGARLLVGKVFDGATASDSGIIAGMQWAVQQKARIVSMSLGGTDSIGADPIEQAVNDLSKSSGTLFTIAAGNEGPDDATVDSPGSAESALTVAAVDREDRLADFSSRGPTADNAMKPDLSAPGVEIAAAKAAHSPGSNGPIPGYVVYSGTSMATPAVAGAVAIVAQQHPDWTGPRLKAAVMASAKPLAGQSAYAAGAGRVDLTRAIRQEVSVEPASLDLGVQQWPHADDKPVRRTLTYSNFSDRPVTLDLSMADPVGPVGPGDRTASAALFSVSPARLTIPAGGTAKATVTADTRTGGPADGLWSASVTATGGGQTVRTPVGVVREVPSYTLTLKVTGRDGKPARNTALAVAALDRPRLYLPYDYGDKDGDGVVTVRLPKGRYTVDTMMEDDNGSRSELSWLVTPRLMMDRDRALTLDARTAKPVRVTAPDARARLRSAQLLFAAGTPGTGYYNGLIADDYDTVRVAQAGPSAPTKDFVVQYGGIWQRGATDPLYGLVVTRRGSMFTGLNRTVSARGLAKIVTAMGPVPAGARVTPSAAWTVPGWEEAINVPALAGVARKAPYGSAVNYLSAEGGLRWKLTTTFGTEADSLLGSWEGEHHPYLPGRSYRERNFGTAVFGPSLPEGYGGEYMKSNYGICVPLFSDGSGHTGYLGPSEAAYRTRFTMGDTVLLDEKQDLCDSLEGGSGLSDRTARYRLSMDATRRAAVYRVGTRVSTVWDFTLRPSPDAYVTMPLSVVRFTPKLSLDSTAKAGTRISVPLVVQGAAAAPGALKSLAVKVSYDGGRTWKSTAVHGAADGKRSVTLSQPKTPGSVSFRATAVDTKGNRVTQTLIDAYRTVN